MSNVIDIETENGFLELDNVSVRIVRESTLFKNTASPSFYSYPIAVPATPRNLQKIGFNHLPESATKIKSRLPVKIYTAGQYRTKCILYIEEYKNGIIDCNLLPYTQESLSVLLKKSLREIDLGVFNNYALPEQRNYYCGTYDFLNGNNIGIELSKSGDYLHNYTINWNANWQGMITDLIDNINADNSSHHFNAWIIETPIEVSVGRYQFTYVLVHDTTFLNGPDSVTPLLFASHVINFEHLNAASSGKWNLVEHMNRITDDTNRNLYEKVFQITHPYRFPIIHNPLMYGNEENPIKDHIINFWFFGTQRHGTNMGSLKNFPGYLAGVCACAKVGFVLSKVFEAIGFKLDTQFFDEVELDSIIFISSGIVVNFDLNNADFRGPQYIDLRKSLPDDTLSDFIDGLKTTFGLKIDYNFKTGIVRVVKSKSVIESKNSVDFTQRKSGALQQLSMDDYNNGFNVKYDFDSIDENINQRTKILEIETIGTSVSTFSALPTTNIPFGEIRLVEDEDKYYLFDIDPTTLVPIWFLYCDNLINKRIENFQYEYSLKLSPALIDINIPQDFFSSQSAGGNSTHLLIKVPSIRYICKSPLQQIGKNPVPMKIAFYRGLQNNGKSPAVKYPMASHDDKNYTGTTVFDYSLKIDGANGIYEKFLKPILNFLKHTSKFEGRFMLNSEEIFDFDSDNFWMLENIKYYPQIIDVEFNNAQKRIKPAKVTLYKS